MNEYLRPLRAVFNGTVVTVIDANGRSVPWTVIEELLNYSARPEARASKEMLDFAEQVVDAGTFHGTTGTTEFRLARELLRLAMNLDGD